jgi:hypothetical protein
MAQEPTTTKAAAAAAAEATAYTLEPAPVAPEAEYVIDSGEGGDNMTGSGWLRLGDEKKVPAGERGSAEDVAIEMTETMSQGNTIGTAGAGDGVEEQSTNLGTTAPGEYKVYKRRWFGLVQLVLLNIMASWSVSLNSVTSLNGLAVARRSTARPLAPSSASPAPASALCFDPGLSKPRPGEAPRKPPPARAEPIYHRYRTDTDTAWH